jgi:hypothetical protein
MQWGLPKELLKEIWEVVAGDEGQLTCQQFLACLYLMDNAKKGIPPPKALPPGPFPPLAPSGAPAAKDLSIDELGASPWLGRCLLDWLRARKSHRKQ